MWPLTMPTIFLLYFLIQNLLFLPLFVSFGHVMAYCYQLQISPLGLLISSYLQTWFFSSPLPLHASLDFIMDSRHISEYSLPQGLSDDQVWHRLLLNAQWSHSTHNCIVQIILFLCNFLDLFHFSSSYCLLCLTSKKPTTATTKARPIATFLSFCCLPAVVLN